MQSRGYDALEHIHAAPQLSLAAPGSQIVCGDSKGAAVYFPSEHPHAIESDSNAIVFTFLLNPVYPATRALAHQACPSRFFQPQDGIPELLQSLDFKPDDAERLKRVMDQLLAQLTDPTQAALPLDDRIAEVVTYIDELEEKRVAAGDLAEQIALSESRFLHLFKEEMKMTVRKYLLWRRTADAARLVVEGKSITDSAHATGFTDSAHLARTFKQMFGITLSTAFGKLANPELVIAQGLS